MQPSSTSPADRRVVTVVFADISGFTSMSEHMDPEDVTALMNDCFERLSSVIRRYDGTIDKYIGDCIMALFGAPVAMEDAPQRALNAAIEMREEIERFRLERRLEKPLTLHIGVNTGEVIYGAVGSREQRQRTAMGDAVNLASRLEDASAAGQILVGPETYRRTASLFDFAPRGALQLKGKEKRVATYELRSRTASLGRARSGHKRAPVSAMVGRERELERLEMQVQKGIDGEGSIVPIIGEPGIGKSRIVAELRRKVAGKRLHVLEGRALSTGRTLGYHVFDDLIRRWCGIAERDGPAEAMQKLERLLGELVGSDLEEILPLVALLTGMGLTGSRLERVRIIEQQSLAGMVATKLRQVLTAAARDRALLVVIEDLHWADSSSVELLESLLRLVDTSALVFVIVARPGYEETSGRVRTFTAERFPSRTVEIHLSPLSDAQCSELLGGLALREELPQPLRDRILERSGGNPFFVEEIVRSLEGSGRLGQVEGVGVGAKSVEPVQIPSTVNEVIMSRFDRLEEPLQELLRAAAVIGRSFHRAILEQISVVAGGFEAGIERLKELEVIREHERQAEVEYVFVHAVVQETIYGSILLQRRRELHRKAANAIETRFGDRLQELYGLLAYHYGQSDDEGKFAQYLNLAGEQALRSAASSEATAFLTQALDLYLRAKGAGIDRRRAAWLERGIGMSHAARGEYQTAIRHFNAALAYLGVRPGEVGAQGVLHAVLGFLSLVRSVYLAPRRRGRVATENDLLVIDIEHRKTLMYLMGGAATLLVAAMSLFRLISRFVPASVPEVARYYCEGSGIFSLVGFPGIAKRMLDYAAPKMDLSQARDRYTLEFYRLLLGALCGVTPVVYDAECRKEMIRAGDYFAYQVFLVQSGMHEVARGELAYAATLAQESMSLAEETSHKQVRINAAQICLLLALQRHHYADVAREYPRFEPWLSEGSSEFQTCTQRSLVAQAEIMMGNVEQAAALLEKDRVVLARSGYTPRLYRAELDYARLLLAVRRLEHHAASRGPGSTRRLQIECRKRGRQSVAASRGHAFTRVPTYRAMGSWLWLARRPRRAFSWWGRSIDEAERLGHRLELSRTFFEIGCRLRAAPPRVSRMRDVDSDGYLARAEVLFREIGLDRDLEALAVVRGA